MGIVNVFIVVVNVKMNMGERIADASMASKGFSKMAATIDMYLCKLKTGGAGPIGEVLTQITTTQDMLDANLTYPEILPKMTRKGAVVPSASGSFGGMSKDAAYIGGLSTAAAKDPTVAVAAMKGAFDASASGAAQIVEEGKGGLAAAATLPVTPPQ